MDVKVLVVGKGVLEVISRSPHLTACEDLDPTASIQRIGIFGHYPVYYDESLPPDKIIIAYTPDPGEGELDPERVKHWRDELPENHDGGDWVLLTDRRPPDDAFTYRRLGESETDCREHQGSSRGA